MMQKTHHISEEEIALTAELVLAEKKEQIPESVQTHLIECDQCASELISIMELLNDENEIDTKEIFTPQIKKNTIKLNWYWAAGIAAVFLISLFIFNPFEESDPINSKQLAHQKEVKEIEIKDHSNIKTSNKETAKTTPPKIKEEVKKDVALNQKFENQILEYQNAYRDEGFKLKSPVFLISSKHDKIQWESSDETFIIEWWSVNEKLIKEQNTTENFIDLPQFKNGVYYYKLLNDDFDVLAVGRWNNN